MKNSKGRCIAIPHRTVIRAIDYYFLDARSGWLAQDDEKLTLNDAGGAEVNRIAALSDNEDDEMARTRDPGGREAESRDYWMNLSSSRGF
jgi:hypothetical protein